MKLLDLIPYFNVSYYPVLVKYQETYIYDSRPKFSAEVYRCTEDDFVQYKNGFSGLAKLDHVSCYVLPQYSIGGQQLHEFKQEYIDHVGNECQEGIINNTYFSRLAVFHPDLTMHMFD